MTRNILKNNVLRLVCLGGTIMTLGSLSSSPANAQIDMAQKPVLVITNKAMPATANANLTYSRPSRAPEITSEQITRNVYFEEGSTVVGRKVSQLSQDLFGLQNRISRLSEQLNAVETRGQNNSASYYANIATINTQLQTGTTPGNPRLIKRLDTAQANLDTLAANITDLNALAIEIADAASKGSYLLETTRAAYGLSGAVEEDHARLAQMEDQINSSIVKVDRLLNDVNDGITRTTAYLGTERNNLRTLSLAITNGELYGKSLANYPFSRAPQTNLLQQASFTPGNMGMMPPGAMGQNMGQAPMAPSTPGVGQPRPLAKIRFDKPDINYQQPIYAAVQNALQRFPGARFELIAVHPNVGNAAQVAIESTKSRRNAERVLRALTQMGVPLEKIDMSYAPSAQARSSEVHLFLR